MAWKVNSVSERPSSPASNFIVGTQRPKSRPGIVEATKPSKFPVTALVTAPAPTAGDVHRRVEPEPVQVPAAPVAAGAEAAEVDATTAVSTAAAADEVVYHLLDEISIAKAVRLTARVTVRSVVPPHAATVEPVATGAALATEAAVSFAVLPLEEVPRDEAATLVPSTATAVKLEKP